MKQAPPRWMTEIFANDSSGPYPDYAPDFQRWLELVAEYPYLNVITDGIGEKPRPRPMDRDHFLALLGTLHREPHRQIVQEVLLELLADGIIEIVNALRKEDAA